MKKRILAVILCLCMAATLLPAAAWANTPAGGYEKPVVSGTAIASDNKITVTYTFPTESNELLASSPFYVKLFYDYTVNGHSYRIDRRGYTGSANAQGEYADTLAMPSNMDDTYTVYASAVVRYADGTEVESDPVALTTKPQRSSSQLPIKIQVPKETLNSYTDYEYGYNGSTLLETADITGAAFNSGTMTLTLTGDVGGKTNSRIQLSQLYSGYNLNRLVLMNANFDYIRINNHKPLIVELVGNSTGDFLFEGYSDVFFVSGQSGAKPSLNGTMITHGQSSGTDTSAVVMSGIHYTASPSAEKLSSYSSRTTAFAAVAFDDCDVNITRANDDSYAALSTSGGGNMGSDTRINGVSVIARDCDSFRIQSNGKGIDAQNGGIIFDNTDAVFTVGTGDGASNRYGINTNGTVQFTNSSDITITGAYSAYSIYGIYAPTGFIIDGSSELSVSLCSPASDTYSPVMYGVQCGGAADIAGTLDITLENANAGTLRALSTSKLLSLQGAGVSVSLLGKDSVTGIKAKGIEAENSTIAVDARTAITTGSKNLYGINNESGSITFTGSTVDVHVRCNGDTAPSQIYGLYSGGPLSVAGSVVRLGLHQAENTLSPNDYYRALYTYQTATSINDGRVSLRVPANCLESNQSYMEGNDNFSGLTYELAACTCTASQEDPNCLGAGGGTPTLQTQVLKVNLPAALLAKDHFPEKARLMATTSGTAVAAEVWSGKPKDAVSVFAFTQREFSKMELQIMLGGAWTTVAKYESDFSSDDEITLATVPEAQFYYVSGISVTETGGSTVPGDRYRLTVTTGGAVYPVPGLFPAGTYNVSLSSVPSPVLYDFTGFNAAGHTFTVSADGTITVGGLGRTDASISVGGTVTEYSTGTALQGVRVTASQTLANGYTYSTSALTGSDGTYALSLYDGVQAELTLSYNSYVKMDSDTPDTSNSATVASPSGGTTQNFVMKKMPASRLTLNYSFETAADDAATLKYLANLSDSSFTLRAQIAGSPISRSFTGSFAGSLTGVYSLWSNEDAARLITGNKTVTLVQTDGQVQMVGTPIIQLDVENCNTASLTFIPKAGIVAELVADKNKSIGNYEARWFDTSGNYVGTSTNNVTINGNGQTVSFICPGAAGDYTVVFAPTAVASVQTLSELEPDLARRTMTIEAGKGLDLGEITLLSAATENALYITKPGSTLTSAYGQTDSSSTFFNITGTVGTDGDIQGPALKKLVFKTNGEALISYVTIKRPGDIASTRYVPQTDGGTYDGSYITFAEPVSLDTPLNFDIYAVEQSSGNELTVTVTADISYTGGQKNNQLIGEISEMKRKATIDAPARTADDSVAVSGFMPAAPASSKIAIYDGERLVGTANCGNNGKWSAVVALAGTQAAAPTVHYLTARFGNTESDAVTVIHNANGAALVRQGMYLEGRYYAADGSYMWYPRYEKIGLPVVLEAEIENPSALRNDYNSTMELDGIFAEPVVFSVQLSNGEIRFFEGNQVGSSGIFKTDSFVVNSPIIGTEVLYGSADVFAAPDADGVMTRTEELSTCLENIASVEAETHTQTEVDANLHALNDTEGIDDAWVLGSLTTTQQAMSAAELITTQLRPLSANQIAVYNTDREITEAIFSADMNYAKARQLAGAGSLTKTSLQEGGRTAYDVYRFVEENENSLFTMSLIVRYTASGTVDGYYETSVLFSISAEPFIGANALFTDSAEPFERIVPVSRLSASTVSARSGGTMSAGTFFGAVFDSGGAGASAFADLSTIWNSEASAAQFGNVGNVFASAGIVTTVWSGISTNSSYDQMLDATQGMLNSPCLDKLSPRMQAAVKQKINSHIQLIKEGKSMNFTVSAEGTVLGAASFLKLAPGWGTFIGVGSGITNLGNNLSNDWMNKSINTEYQMMQDDVYRIYQKNIIDNKNNDIKNLEDCRKQKDPVKPKAGLDPSGVIYEAVLSNRVEDATVTLYRENSGNRVMVASGSEDIFGERNPLISDEFGYYEWFVPAGLWLVTAEKDGYVSNDSQSCVNIPAADKQDVNGTIWLKVLPPQTEVHIGLTNNSAPYVKEIAAVPDGVIIEFSRYMKESTLIPANFTLTGASITAIQFLNSEASPTDAAVSYTSRIKLQTGALTEGANINIGISADVESYAGTKAGSAYANLLTVSEVYALTISGGTVIGGETTGQFVAGASVTIVPDAPRAGMTFSEWQSDYNAVDGSTDTTLTFTMPAKAVSVSAQYSGNALGVRNTGYDNTNTGAGNPDPEPGYQGGGGGGAAALTVPVSGEENTIQVAATVSGSVATLSMDADKLQTVIGASVDTGNVTIDLTALNKNINTAIIESVDWKALSDAANSSANDMTGLTVKFDTGTLAFDAKALAAAVGGDVTVSLTQTDTGGMTEAEKLMVGDRPVYDITVLSGGKAITDLNGGSITVSIPYTPKAGEDTSYLVIWYLNEKGELETTPCSYANGTLTFTLDHLSEYIVAYFPFTDVTADKWYYGNVAYAYMAKLMQGIGNDLFDPASPTSRAMIVTILYRLEGEPAVTTANPFDDVASGKWYTDAVIWASANKIVEGYGNGKFGPEDDITREQMAAILWRYAKYKGYDMTNAADLSKFSDNGQISTWAQAAMSWSNANELINGKGGGILDPKGDAERCQVAAILHRFCESIVKHTRNA